MALGSRLRWQQSTRLQLVVRTRQHTAMPLSRPFPWANIWNLTRDIGGQCGCRGRGLSGRRGHFWLDALKDTAHAATLGSAAAVWIHAALLPPLGFLW